MSVPCMKQRSILSSEFDPYKIPCSIYVRLSNINKLVAKIITSVLILIFTGCLTHLALYHTKLNLAIINMLKGRQYKLDIHTPAYLIGQTVGYLSSPPVFRKLVFKVIRNAFLTRKMGAASFPTSS